MDHRLFAVLAIVCFALGGAGCASESQIANREEILMPLQTGSVFQRRVMVEKDATKKSKKKKDKKEKEEKKEKEKKQEPKRTTPKPTPAPEPEASPEPPVQESTPPPDRFR